MTRIGILSDIHADIDGLNHALDFFERQKVDEVWCAGDLVDRGSDGNAVVNRIRHAQIPTVQGNHDALARRSQDRLKNDLRFMDYLAENPEIDEGLMLMAEISEINLNFLDLLPPVIKFRRHNLQIEITHANTFDQITYIYPTSRLDLFHQTLKASVADIIVLGHTHRPMKIFEGGKLRIINSGSVSMNHGRPEQSCGILFLPEREFMVYDLQTERPVPVTTLDLDERS